MARFGRGGKLLTVAALAMLEAAFLREPPRLLAQEPAPAKPAAPMAEEEQERPRDGLRRLFNEARTLPEIWDALSHERDMGAHDNVAYYIDRLNAALAALDPEARDKAVDSLLKGSDFSNLQSLQDLPTAVRDGGDKKLAERLRKGLDTLKATLDEHFAKQQTPEKLQELVDRLIESPAAKREVMRELNTRGGFAVGPLLSLGRRTTEETDTREVAKALLELPASSLPGLIGALDVPDRDWQRRIVNVLLVRSQIGEDVKSALPAMQLVLADPELPEDTRILARQLVAQLRGVEQGRLPGVADMLSETADQMYQGSYAFGEGTANQIFRWVKGKGLVAGTVDGQEVPVVSKPQAAQYWGARSARKALESKPGDPVARRALLGLSIENEVTRQRAAGKPFQPIGQSQPALLELLAGQDSPTLNLMLRQALKQDRQALALALLEALSSRGDETGGVERGNTSSTYELALESGEPRVRFAAARAIARLPKPPSARVAARVVNTLAGFLTMDKPNGQARARVLMGMDSPDLLSELSHTLERASYQVEGALTARETMQRLLRGPKHDLLVVDCNIPDSDLNHLLAQMEAEGPLSRMPVLVLAMPCARERSCLSTRFIELDARRIALEGELRDFLNRKKEMTTLQKDELTKLDAIYAAKREKNRGQLELGEQNNYEFTRKEMVERHTAELDDFHVLYLAQYHLEDDLMKVRAGLDGVQKDYVIASQSREDRLSRHLAHDKRVKVIRAGALGQPGTAIRTISATLEETSQIPVGPEAQTAMANEAANLLAAMAGGSIRGYDIRPAGKAIEQALGSEVLVVPSKLALTQALVMIPGGSAQARLAGMAGDAARSAPERYAAAETLSRHVQRYGRVILDAQVKDLENTLAATQEPPVRAAISGALALLSKPRGDRNLLDYQPAKSAPAMAPMGENGAEKPVEKPDQP